jgi:hypothetical protein
MLKNSISSVVMDLWQESEERGADSATKTGAKVRSLSHN